MNKLKKILDKLQLPSGQQIVIVEDFAKMDKEVVKKLTDDMETVVNALLDTKK